MNRRIPLALVLLGALGTSACVEDETLVVPAPTEQGSLFRRYVALGNSITAGYMSGGINDSTQRLAYPVLLAARAEATFAIPSLEMPGCPPPLLGVLDTTEAGAVVLETDRVAGGAADWCALRSQPVPPFVQNVAVPGARIADAFDVRREGNASNPLTTLLLGGLTQVDAARRARPSLVSMWLGNNDVLAAALQGDLSLMTPVDTFDYYAQRVVQGIGGASPIAVVVIGVIDVTLAPVLQPGLYYWVADSLGFAPKPVSADCAPTDTLGAPNPLSMNTVSFLAFGDASLAEVSCDPAAPYVLTGAEIDQVQDRVQDFNATLQSHVTERQWQFVSSTNVLNTALLGSGGRNRLRRCEGLDNGDTLEDMVTIVTTQCPHESAPNFFGSLVTYDGVHLSAEAHGLMTNAIAQSINSRFDLSL